MSQAFMGAGYIGRIFERELLDYSQRPAADSPVLLNPRRCSTPTWRAAGSWR
jgi:ABC-2 type transport system permease protein